LTTRSKLIAGLLGACTLANLGAGCDSHHEAAPRVERRAAALGAERWTEVAQPYPFRDPSNGSVIGPQTIGLLTDGRVIAGWDNIWYALPPDSLGNYESSQWQRLANSTVARVFGPSYTLRDGRFLMMGGEYVANTTSYASTELYDPVTNLWTAGPDMPDEIVDTPTQRLGDGRVLVFAYGTSNRAYFFNSFGVTPNWTPAPSWDRSIIFDQEASSQLLQDGSVLVGSNGFQRWLPWNNSWVSAPLPAGQTNAFMMANGSDEMGPLVLLHDGRAMMLGASGKIGTYAPNSDGTGNWTIRTHGFPVGHAADAPAIVGPDGKILAVTSTDPGGDGLSAGSFYEIDPANDSDPVAITAPRGPNDPEWNMIHTADMRLLALPNGKILLTNAWGTHAWTYTPAGTPQNAWRPVLGGSLNTQTMGYLKLQGSQLNGLTTGGDFGDDAKTNTNFPIVSARSGSSIWYGRSMSFEDLRPTPNQWGSFFFTLPNTLPDGTYSIRVAANGVLDSGLLATSLTVAGPRVASVTAPDRLLPTGGYSQGSVTLTAPAPAGGAIVMLQSTNPTVAALPPSITVPAGATSASFFIQVPSTSAGSTSLQAGTTANPWIVASKTFGWSIVSLDGPAVTGDAPQTIWTVTLDGPAPQNGVVINLQNSNPALVSIPASVTVPAGQTIGTFPVTVVNPLAGQAFITASTVGSSKSAPFGWWVASLDGCQYASPNGTDASLWSVTINGPAPTGGLAVNLQAYWASQAVSIPATVTVPAGQISAQFLVTPANLAAGVALIRASVNGHRVDNQFNWSVTSVSGPLVAPAGTMPTWTVNLMGPACGSGLSVVLQSSKTNVAVVPPTVIVPNGQSSATFSLTAVDPTAGRATISASTPAGTQLAPFGYALTNVVLPSTLRPGQTATGTLTVDPPAPAGGFPITLDSARPNTASVSPSSVLIPGGGVSASYTVTAGNTPGSTGIRAHMGAQMVAAPLTVTLF
jgi:hypothetical protein